MTSPTLSISHPSTIYVTDGVPFDVYINVTDVDGDTVNITWEWGDGTPNDTYMTGPLSDQRTMVARTHTWDVPVEQGTGGFTVTMPSPMRITVDDGTGDPAVSQTRTIVVVVPENYGPSVDMSAPSIVDVGVSFNISANASDYEGESLTWTFVYNDSIEDFLTEVYHTNATASNELVWVNVSHVFDEVGNYSVHVYVTDALGENQQTPGHNNSASVFIRAVVNHLPFVGPIDIWSPSVRVLNESIGYLVVTYKIEVYDEDGEVVNATWSFGNGYPVAYNQSEGGKIIYMFYQSVNYTRAGVYNVSVVTTDGKSGHDQVSYLDVLITSNNLPPSIIDFRRDYSEAGYARPNQSINFTITIQDIEGDPVDVNISFGDGTWLNLTLTDFSEGNVTVTFNHTYALKGEYLVEVWYTDYQYLGLFNHSQYVNLTTKVDIPPEVVIDRWSWWDYTSLVLFCMIPVAVVVNFLRLRKRQREIEAQGMTMEEWKLRQSIEFEESMIGKKDGGR